MEGAIYYQRQGHHWIKGCNFRMSQQREFTAIAAKPDTACTSLPAQIAACPSVHPSSMAFLQSSLSAKHVKGCWCWRRLLGSELQSLPVSLARGL